MWHGGSRATQVGPLRPRVLGHLVRAEDQLIRIHLGHHHGAQLVLHHAGGVDGAVPEVRHGHPQVLRCCTDLVGHAAPFQPAVVGCRNQDPAGRSGYAARRFPTIGHQAVEWLVPLASQRHRDALHRAVGHDLEAERGRGMVPVDWVSGAVLLLPVAEVLAIGGLDVGYVMYTEEVDLQLRLRPGLTAHEVRRAVDEVTARLGVEELVAERISSLRLVLGS